MRADRTGCSHDELYLAAESDLQTVLGHIEAVQPTLVVVDSVQTMSSADTDGVAGGVTQVRAVTTALTTAAKTTGVPLILVGHVTKDGAIAGPRSLEHLVDVVLHFEGDRNSLLRMVRGVKNRFGAADEVGCFLLQDNGIEGVADPSGLFLDQRPQPVVGHGHHGHPRRQTAIDRRDPGAAGDAVGRLTAPRRQRHRPCAGGDDHRGAGKARQAEDRRQRRLSVHRGRHAADRPVVGSGGGDRAGFGLRDLPLPATAVMIGEVGLAGDLRRVSGMERRLAEAARQGFTTALVPSGCRRRAAGLRALQAPNIGAALEHMLNIAEHRSKDRPHHIAGRRANGAE